MGWTNRFYLGLLVLVMITGCSSLRPIPTLTRRSRNELEHSRQRSVTPEALPSWLSSCAGELEDGSRILLDGKRISPPGLNVQVQEYARGLTMSPDNHYAYVLTGGHFSSSDGLSHYQSLDVIDLTAETEDQLLVQVIGHPDGPVGDWIPTTRGKPSMCRVATANGCTSIAGRPIPKRTKKFSDSIVKSR